MAIQIPNSFLAYGTVNGVDGATLSGAGFSAERTGPGVYVVTLDQAADATESTELFGQRGAVAGQMACEVTSDQQRTFRTFDAAGAAADRSFSFAVLASPSIA